MNWNIYQMEMRRNLKSFTIWAGSICGILFLGMLFYPAINADGLLTQMEALFENPMMKGMLAAFGADVTSLGSLMGFYVTYNSMYNVLLGCIFASVLAGNLLAKEEAEKTAEFLFTRPVSRKTIFFSKTAVLYTYITLLSLLFFIVSVASMEFVKKDSPRYPEISAEDKQLIMEQIQNNPQVIYEAFNLTDDSFAEYSLTYASRLLSESSDEMKGMKLDINSMNSLLNEAMDSPEKFFENVLNNPERYMSLFSFEPDQQEEFLEHVRGEQIEYNTMKDSFFNSPEVFLLIFEENTSIALNQFTSEPGSMDKTIKLLKLPEDLEKRIFKKYSVYKLAIICTYIYLLILSMGSIVLLISLLVNRGKSVIGPTLGLVFFFYFLNSLSSLAMGFSTTLSYMGYLSPFTWMDTDINAPDFQLTWWRVLYFILISGLALMSAQMRLKRKDILV